MSLSPPLVRTLLRAESVSWSTQHLSAEQSVCTEQVSGCRPGWPGEHGRLSPLTCSLESSTELGTRLDTTVTCGISGLMSRGMECVCISQCDFTCRVPTGQVSQQLPLETTAWPPKEGWLLDSFLLAFSRGRALHFCLCTQVMDMPNKTQIS